MPPHQKMITLLSAILLTGLINLSAAHKVLLLNDIHLDVNST